MAFQPLLLITATRMEAEPLRSSLEQSRPVTLPWGEGLEGRLGGHPVVLAHLGIGKVNTAAGLALAIRTLSPRGVIQFGIGGGYVGAFLSIGMVAAASEEIHLDCGVCDEGGWHGLEELQLPLLEGEQNYYNRLPTDPTLTTMLSAGGPVAVGVFGTAETVTGSFDDAQVLQQRFDLAVESMEGAAAAQVSLALGIPFAELRGISNIVGERDKSAWNIPTAVRAVNDTLLAALRNASLEPDPAPLPLARL